jgi:hypothetical protein
MHRMLQTAACGAAVLLLLAGPMPAHAGGRWSFNLGLWGPPPVYVAPRPYYYDPYPPPVVYRRVYVVDPPPVYVTPPPVMAPAPEPAPATSARPKPPDLVLQKIGNLHSDDSDVREQAAKWLGAVRDPRALRPLTEVLEHDLDHDVREEAARSLGLIGGTYAEQALEAARQSDPSSDVRHAASKALARIAKESNKTATR